jgi:hypothetical protein
MRHDQRATRTLLFAKERPLGLIVENCHSRIRVLPKKFPVDLPRASARCSPKEKVGSPLFDYPPRLGPKRKALHYIVVLRFSNSDHVDSDIGGAGPVE